MRHTSQRKRPTGLTSVLLVASNALVVVVSVAAYVVSARQAAQDEQGHRHGHNRHQEPLLCSRPGAHSTGGDEGDIAEAGGDRELPMSAAAESTQSSSASSSSDS